MTLADFTSPAYYAFLALVAVAAAGLARRGASQAQSVLLAAASITFFFVASGWHILLLVFSTLTDFFIGRRFEVEVDDKRRKRLLQLSLVVNLGLLVLFKYGDLSVGTATTVAAWAGVTLPFEPPGWLLPVGISFYTFQTLSYSIDRYYDRIPAERSLLRFAVFVSFFPQLVAGPIVRAPELLTQLRQKLRARAEDVEVAAVRISLGLFKKLLLADNVAPFVSDCLDRGPDASPVWVVLGTAGFAIQIYCDFSAYSDIAIGSARLFGVRLPENFRWPYFARSPSDFWRRWHITLSSWLRDYLYIPLGGNRQGVFKTYRNLMLTMLLGGLWHGASWNFVVWGALHGSYLVVQRVVAPRIPLPDPLRGPTGWLTTQLGVLLAWLTFRVTDAELLWSHLLAFVVAPLDLLRGAAAFAGAPETWKTALAVGVVFAAVEALSARVGGARHWLPEQPVAVRAVVVTTLLLAAWVFAPGETPAFIYFRF